jgi:hypothetical protein
MSEFAALYSLGLFSGAKMSQSEALKRKETNYTTFVAYRFDKKATALDVLKKAWQKVYSEKEIIGIDNTYTAFNCVKYTDKSDVNTYHFCESVRLYDFTNDTIIVIYLINSNGSFNPDNWLIAFYLETEIKCLADKKSEVDKK